MVIIGINYEILRQVDKNTMVNHEPSNKLSSKLSDNLAFVSPALGGLAGVAIGWVIANLVGIV